MYKNTNIKKSLFTSLAATSLLLYSAMGSVFAQEVLTPDGEAMPMPLPISIPTPIPLEVIHWSYYGVGGPENWGNLLDSNGHVAYPLCGTGIEQSPIDIDETTEANLSKIKFKYKKTPLVIENNGHTIQVNYAPGKGKIKAYGTTYELLQLHFHQVSEHTIEGEHAALEGHLVHISNDGVLAVVGFLMEEGDHNRTFQKILNHMPREKGTKVVPRKFIKASKLLPKDGEYYKYNGSLTTPPCSQGVRWHVLKEPIEISEEQIAEFEALGFLHHNGHFVGNNRPVQPLNDRIVLERD